MNEGFAKSGLTPLVSLVLAAFPLGMLTAAPIISDDVLITAVKDGLHQDVQALLGKGANVNAIDGNRASALAWAVMRDNTPVATLLLKTKADPNIADVNAMTPLRIAIDNQSLHMAKLLLENGA